ncbi:2OG-Fe(II) oxygenase [Gilvimarinus sp. SDUM040013]|uniref:2OG-Fe(II) oxygenase n=1 Tax=Gilvimarinus gilvus TaxID=3058038 RepID=A0ABU4S158_9GAMM|nr:2OG-Fe(II) oxygenase [Gilvimarinus sp. SDUM040013]MDO3384794.1 2OG-Fe(II) oxygenase [Gilvimarinus sp. SDUM040013]MDX6850873.1 2OG-Fe(II) oxygenase [Gilvimarinus sp. SDUM040013]
MSAGFETAIGQTTLQSETLFGQIADDIRDTGYSILPNALPELLIRQLLGQVNTLPADEFSVAGIGRRHNYLHEQRVRTDEIVWITGDTISGALWCQWANKLQTTLNRQLLLGMFSFESHYSHYAPGAYYKRHLDAFKGERNRVLSVVAYLNPDWGDDDGGELVLYTDAAGSYVKVSPQGGTLVVFLSEDFPHEVLPARRDRFAIAGWFRTNTSTTQRIDPPR